MADIDVTYTPGDEPEEQEETSQREKLLNDSQFMADAYSFITKRTSEIPKTDDEVYDKFMEHMRFHETNEVTAVRDLMYAQESDQQSREEFARLLQTWDESEGDPMSWTKAMDYVEAGITAPSTWVGLISGGTGKVTGQAAVQAAKTGLRAYLTKEVGKGMVKGALAEGAIGLGTGAAQEGTRVETGAQEEFTGERTVTSALTQGAFGTIPGGIGGFQQGTRRLEASQLRQSYEAARGAKAEAAEKKVRSVISDAKKNNPTVVEKTKGEVLTGTVLQARKFLEESKLRALPEERVREGLELLAGMTESEKIAASLSDDVLERVTAATIELGKKVKPEPGERITETIGRYIEEGKVGDQSINEFLDEFNLSQREFNSIFVAELSRAGQTLSRASKVSRAVKGTKTAKQRTEEQQKILTNVVNAFEEFDATIGFGVSRETALAITSQAKKQTAQDTWLQNIDRLRLSMMTAQLATTVRNTAGGAFRVAVDVVDKGSRNIISRSLGRTDEITESPLAISNYLLFNQAEAKLIKQLFEENMPKEAGEFYGAFLETATVSSRVANTSVMNKVGASVNMLNRASDNMFKQAIFAGRLDQLVRKNMNKSLHDVIAAGDFNKIDNAYMKEAIEESLEYLYQKTPQGTDIFSKGGRLLIKGHREIPVLISSIMPFPRFVINQLSFVSQNMPVLGLAASKALGKNVTDTDVLAKQVTGMGLLSSAYYMRAQAGTNSEWYHVKTAEGDLVDVRAIAGPLNAFLLAADMLYRTNAGGKLSALLAGKDMKEVPDDEVMSTLEGMKAGWQALGGPAFRAGTGLAGIDRIIEEMNAESGIGLKSGIVFGTFLGDMANTFTLPLATARDVMSLTDAEARQLPEGNYVNGWDIFAIRATRSLPTLESASLSEWISSNAGTGIVGEKEERIDILTGEPMRYIDPLERQIFGVSKVAEPNELQKEMMRLQIKSYDLFNPADYPEEERLIRELAAPAIAERLNTYVLSDEYAELEDQPKLKKGVLRQKVQEIIQEYRPQVRERIEVEQQAAVQPGESTESDRFAFEKIPSRDRAIIMEQYELQYDRPMGEDFRGALELWEESIKPRMKQMAEGGFVDDPLMLSETAEEEDPEIRRREGEDYLKQMIELGLDMAPVTGEIRSGQQALKDFEEGNYGMAALGALGAVPIVGAPARKIRKLLDATERFADKKITDRLNKTMERKDKNNELKAMSDRDELPAEFSGLRLNDEVDIPGVASGRIGRVYYDREGNAMINIATGLEDNPLVGVPVTKAVQKGVVKTKEAPVYKTKVDIAKDPSMEFVARPYDQMLREAKDADPKLYDALRTLENENQEEFAKQVFEFEKDKWLQKTGKTPNTEVTERNKIMQNAANQVKEGKLDIEEFRKIADQHKPVKVWDNAPEMATYEDMFFALDAKKRQSPFVGYNARIPEGTRMTSRLDIPAYTSSDTWVVTLKGDYNDGKNMYAPAVRLKNVDLNQSLKNQEKALGVAAGKAKGPFAVMEGDYVEETAEDTYRLSQEALESGEWTQVGYDPTRRGFFYDRETMEPVLGAEEILQVGPMVLAKKAVKGDPKDFKFNRGGLMARK